MINFFGGYPLFIPSPRYTPKPDFHRASREPVLWKRKTCKTCECLYHNHCPHCKDVFGLYIIKPKHAACRYYQPKNK